MTTEKEIKQLIIDLAKAINIQLIGGQDTSSGKIKDESDKCRRLIKRFKNRFNQSIQSKLSTLDTIIAEKEWNKLPNAIKALE